MVGFRHPLARPEARFSNLNYLSASQAQTRLRQARPTLAARPKMPFRLNVSPPIADAPRRRKRARLGLVEAIGCGAAESPGVAFGRVCRDSKAPCLEARGAGQLCDKNVMRVMVLFYPLPHASHASSERRLGIVEATAVGPW